MITVRPGSHVCRLLWLLSVAGEFPFASLSILGNERYMKRLVNQLGTHQDFRSDSDGPVLSTKLLTVSGRGKNKTVRLYKNALPILEWLHPDAHGYYLDSFQEHRFSGSSSHIWRNHRVSEVLAMCMMAGVETRPYLLPRLQKQKILRAVPDYSAFYIARDFKKLDQAELNKTMFTRITGMLFYPGGAYALYNTRDAVMKWSGAGEFKTKHFLVQLARMNAGIHEIQSAMLIGVQSRVVLQTLDELEKSIRLEMGFNKIYSRIHFIPRDQNGIRLMRMLILPDWHEKIMSSLFSPQMRPQGYGSMEYDAMLEKTYIYSHLDGDIARLFRFRRALLKQTEKFEVLCFPWQAGYLHEYLGQHVILKQLEVAALETALGIKPSPAQREEADKT